MTTTNVPTLEIQLPSRGVLYGGRIPDGKVKIRKWTVQELTILEAQGEGATDRMKRIVSSCCTLPNAFDPNELLMTDRFAILLAQRTFSLGSPKYQYEFQCKYCTKVNRGAVCNIQDDFDESFAPDDLKEPIIVELPDAGVQVGLRFLRGSDEDAVIKISKRLKMQSNDAADPSSVIRLARQIAVIDGNDQVNLADRETFTRRLTAGDVSRMRNALDAVEPSIDTTLYPTCKFCTADNKIDMPFDVEFFRPTVM